MKKDSGSGFKIDGARERTERLKLDIEVREQELRRLRNRGREHTKIEEFQGELASLNQALNMLAGPSMREKVKRPFFV